MDMLYFARHKETGAVQNLPYQHLAAVEEFLTMANSFIESDAFEMIEIPVDEFEKTRGNLRYAT